MPQRGGGSVLSGNAAVGDVESGKTFYNTEPTTKETGTLALTGDAEVGDVKSGKTFYKDGLKTKKTGAGTKTLSAANENVEAGYYAATTLSAVDPDLAPENIMKDETIFGKAGNAIGKQYNLGDTIILSHDALTQQDEWVWAKQKTITINSLDFYRDVDQIRIYFEMRTNQSSTIMGRLKKNDVDHGTERSTNSSSFQNYTEDLVYVKDDEINLWAKGWDQVGVMCEQRNLRVKGTLVNFSFRDTPLKGTNSTP